MICIFKMAQGESDSSYIYCILLPFQYTCNSKTVMFPKWSDPEPPKSKSVVAKVGITKNPSERLYDIYNAFEQFGEPQPLLRQLARSDDPQTAIAKAKLMDEIIFIEEVHTPENAEHDIRDALQAGQPKLPQELFFTSFAAYVPKEKMGYLDVVGKTEWIMMKNKLADKLKEQFRSVGTVCIRNIGLLGYVVPDGKQLTRDMNHKLDIIYKIFRNLRPNSYHADRYLPIMIEFKATNFKYTLR